MESFDVNLSEAGQTSMTRVRAFIDGLPGRLRLQADALMARHGYTGDNSGPHANVQGHPLLQLPMWVDAATDGELDPEVMSDVLESSLCGYLSVRAEDDFFDGERVEPKPAMMLADSFRARHHALLARHISAESFWSRSEVVWVGYAEAMLLETELNSPSSECGEDEFDVVLARSQPLELPADAVLSLKASWAHAPALADLVRHLAKATQLFDDFVDAPEDLANGNHTWMVRRLGGSMGEQVLRRGMVEMCDEVFAEAYDELDRAVRLAGDLGLTELPHWADARKQEMVELSEKMFRALFGAVTMPMSAKPSANA